MHEGSSFNSVVRKLYHLSMVLTMSHHKCKQVGQIAYGTVQCNGFGRSIFYVTLLETDVPDAQLGENDF